MEKKKITVNDIKTAKEEGRKLTMITCYDYIMAQIVDSSESEMILVGDSLANIIQGEKTTLPATLDQMVYHTRLVTSGAPNAFVVGDMPFGSYQVSTEQALESAIRLMKEGGCDAVKLEGGAEIAEKVKLIVQAGIPVMTHIGLTPQSINAIGGFKVQGKDKAFAEKLLADAKALEEAGSFAIVLECIPSGVAKRITEECAFSTMGTGAGPYVDIQGLNLYDITGMFSDYVPKFVKQYANVREDMISGLNEYHSEVNEGIFPDKDHSYNAEVEGFSV